MKQIHYFGIRHHGPGCSARLVAALDKLKPKKVLIEGPADCSELLPLLAHQQMQPPVALLAYATEFPQCHFYYPFATFSPEYQACLWAAGNGADVAFIDVPVNIKLANALQDQAEANGDDQVPDAPVPLSFDPIGALAKAAGYDDGESWWNDFLEQSYVDGDDQAVFAAIAQVMTVLRQCQLDDGQKSGDDEVREAYMRQEIARHSKDGDVVAVVCGAWHVPALDDVCQLTEDGKLIKFTNKADNLLIKTLPKKLAASKVKTTWIPWTSLRLSSAHYGAGVDAPMWYLHLWQNRFAPNVAVHWLTKVANALRDEGHLISTASVIEAVRLASSLALLRGRPAVGFEELSEASVACLCFGEKLLWQQIADKLLLGQQVGQIPADTPLAPLLEDLQRLQKQTKLAPLALAKEILVDLRSDIGLKKSLLLHRLNVLGVSWGERLETSSRGTFREKWLLAWQPEFAVALVENLVYGNTIEQASANKLSEIISAQTDLSQLATSIWQALEAGLDKAANAGLARLSEQAVHTDNALALIKSIAPLVHLQRYGTARQMALDKVGELVDELTIKSAIALPYAIKNINDEEAKHYHQYLVQAHSALSLCQDAALMDEWWQTFEQIASGVHAEYHPMVRGLIMRLLYQATKVDADTLAQNLQQALSPAITPVQSAKFFEGFFAGATAQLLYDKLLLAATQAWLLGLDEADFIEYLPLFRRVFSALDSSERKRLLEMIFDRQDSELAFVYHQAFEPMWQHHLLALGRLLGAKDSE